MSSGILAYFGKLTLWSCLLAVQGISQTAGGSFLGVVTITNVETGISRAMLTNQNGAYHAPNLQLGSYELKVQAAGFTVGLRKGVTLDVGAEVLIDFSLKIGNVTETVEVVGDGVAVDLPSSTVNQSDSPPPDDLARHDCCHRAAPEAASIERGIAALRERLIDVVCPLDVRTEDGDIARSAWRERPAIEPQHGGWSGCEQRDQFAQRNPAGMDQDLDRQANRRL